MKTQNLSGVIGSFNNKANHVRRSTVSGPMEKPERDGISSRNSNRSARRNTSSEASKPVQT